MLIWLDKLKHKTYEVVFTLGILYMITYLGWDVCVANIGALLVVSTVGSGILLAHFSTVECITTISFLF